MTDFAYLPGHEHPRKYLFVASTGGHLAQLLRFSRSMNASVDSLWVTSPGPQSESLLSDRRVLYLPYVGARDPRGVLRTALASYRALGHESFDIAISTGSAFALGVFLTAALKHIPRVFIESVSRVKGPSATGRIMYALRLASMKTQHPGWAYGRWTSHASVLSQFATSTSGRKLGSEPKVFVTLGTFRRYRFDRLVDAVKRAGLGTSNTTWQLGATPRTDLPGDVREQVSAREFRELAAAADVVITHSGVGSILELLEMGVVPVVVPRRAAHDEHVDDHQIQIAQLVSELNIAVTTDADDLTIEHARKAASLTVEPDSRPAQ